MPPTFMSRAKGSDMNLDVARQQFGRHFFQFPAQAEALHQDPLAVVGQVRVVPFVSVLELVEAWSSVPISLAQWAKAGPCSATPW